MSEATRRDLLKAGAAVLATGPAGILASSVDKKSSFLNLLRTPDQVKVFGPKEEEIKLDQAGIGRWTTATAELGIAIEKDRLALTMRGDGVSRIQLRWHGDQRAIRLYLGDHWERSYADLEWRGESPNRTMPWYFMAHDSRQTHGYGVQTHPGALCFWMADSEGISLWADVRSGGVPVELGDRTLEVAKVLCREGRGGESAFAATQAFCRQMCPNPRLPKLPVYGTNDWNYAYGNNSADLISSVSGLISELSPDTNNRPFSVIDEGWAMGPYNNNFGHGPWEGNPRFGDMGLFAHRMKGLGVRPGIWFRPLTPLSEMPASWHSTRSNGLLDPTIPEVQHHVEKEMRKFVGWGYEMVKHDYTSFDILGQWGSQMGAMPTRDGWSFHDKSKTTAEIIIDLYRTIREAAGEALLIGCNTMSHLAVGFHELQRTGDDTSGRSWNRNRRMGVNTLAFRAPQHRTFYEVDPDIVSITDAVPWSLVEQWLRLVSQSGAALFVAVQPEIVQPHHRKALRAALEHAATSQTDRRTS